MSTFSTKSSENRQNLANLPAFSQNAQDFEILDVLVASTS